MRLRTFVAARLNWLVLPLFALAPVVGPASLSETKKITSDHPQEITYHGYDVAVDSDTLVVGAYSEDANGLESSGAVYVYRRNGGATWNQEAFLTPSDAMAGGLFGVSVAVHGRTIVVGAIGQGDNGQPFAGAAYVFTHRDGAWVQEAKLVAAEPESGDYLGQDVAVDNGTALIGTFGNNQNDGVLIFTRTDSGWTQHTKLVTDAADVGHYGAHVALQGNFALVGAYDEDVGEFADAGAVYAYVRGADGRWWFHGKLTAPDIRSGQWFGAAVAIRDNLAVIGSPFWRQEFVNSGAAYVFVRDGSNWSAAAQLLPPDVNRSSAFGHSVAIGGNYILAGAPGDEAAYVFRDSQLQQTLSASDGQSPNQFGYSVSASGNNAAVGAPQAPTGGMTFAGAAYVYRP